MCITKNGVIFIACSIQTGDYNVRVFDTNVPHLKRGLDQINVGGIPHRLWITRDEKSLFVVTSAGEIKEINTQSRKVVRTIKVETQIEGERFLICGTSRVLIVTKDSAHKVVLIDLQSGEELGFCDIRGWLTSMCVTPDEACLIVAHLGDDPPPRNSVEGGRVAVIDLQTRIELDRIKLDASVSSVAVTPDGINLVVAHGQYSLVYVSAPTGVTELDLSPRS
jgi:DNA-binding beta-propeller fold protein YncE